MTHEEKINYMRIAAGVCRFGIDNEQLDLLVSIYEKILEKQGETDMKDLAKIQVEVKKRSDIKRRSELLDNFAPKIDA